MDKGTIGSELDKVASYTDNSMQTTVTNVTSGAIYTFMFRSWNVVGYSPFSDGVQFAITLPPVKPLTPTKNLSLST
jgi:hypothetical protein